MARRPKKPPERGTVPDTSALQPWRKTSAPEGPVLRPPPPPREPPPAHFQQLDTVWARLRGSWSWLAVIPGDRDFSTAALTQALCRVGSQLSVQPIGFVEATDVDLDSASKLIGQLGTANATSGVWPSFSRLHFSSDSFGPPVQKAIVALESPLVNPLALPIALAADGVVLCVRRGKSPIAEIRETIDAVGSDRVLCCIFLD